MNISYFQQVFLTSRGSLPPDISSEISKFPPAGRISSEHGSRVRSFIPLGLSYTTRLNGAYTKIDLSYTRLNGAFAIIDPSYTRLNGPFIKIYLS